MLINVDIITFSIFSIFINPYTISLWGSKRGSKFYEFSRQETGTQKVLKLKTNSISEVCLFLSFEVFYVE